jgi:hypothetical protein
MPWSGQCLLESGREERGIIAVVGGSRRWTTEAALFGLLALITELTGRSVTLRLDRAFHVEPLAAPMTSYYPFALAAVRLLAALGLAAVAWRLVRAHANAAAGETLLRTTGHHRFRRPRLRLSLSPRLWLASFGATALWFLIQNDAERLSEGRWPLLAPWLHTYALLVFAVLSILLALGWGAVRNWLHEVERYAAATFARVCRMIRGEALPGCRSHASPELGPRRLFGDAFESRPPPLPA